MNNKFSALQEHNDNSSSEELNNDGVVEISTSPKQQQPPSKKKESQEDEMMICSATPLEPNENPLTNKFCFWFSKRPNGKVDAKAFEKSMIPIGICSSVQQFWQLYHHMHRIDSLPNHQDVHLFKDGIKPLWEDPANREGGKWFVKVKKTSGRINRCWEDLLMAITGEQFMVGQDEICGVVCSIRYNEDVIAVWNRNSQDDHVVSKIRDTFARVTDLQPHLFEYKKHNDMLNRSRNHHVNPKTKFDSFLENNHRPNIKTSQQNDNHDHGNPV